MTTIHTLKRFSFLKDLEHLIYPSICLACENELAISEKNICSICDNNLIRTSFHLYNEPTDTDKLFWGRVKLKRTYSHFYFKKDSSIQKVLFNLKYKNDFSIGAFFGKEIGKSLATIEEFKTADALIPVPLHFKKEFIRGYNQSFAISIGISEEIEVPVKSNYAKRVEHTSTQTRKSRFQRWDNVNSIFSIHTSIKKLKHVVLVDDVVTTGSTLEALVRSIKEVAPEIEVSIVTLAIT
jgi:competence protein ComFC